MDPQVASVVAAARARSIAVGEEIGATAYCVTWSVGEALVMRIPRSDFTNDGPFTLGGTLPSTAALLDASIDRQRAITQGPIARFVDRLELAGVPVALHERAVGRPPARGDVHVIARALAALHEVMGFHGHLAPSTIVVGDTVTFTDPLPALPQLLGGVGYALPIHGDSALRDTLALAAIAAELAGVDLGWTRELAAFLEGVNRGMSRPWDPQPVLAELYRRTDDGWICAVGRLGIDHYLSRPSERPQATRPRDPVPGTARSLLERDELHATLGALARALTASPSLFDFLVHERALPIEASGPRPDPGAAFAAAPASFAAIARALPVLRDAFADAPSGDVPPLAHHADVAEELRPLRTLLVDLDRLLAPTPLAPIGGLLARVTANLELLRDEVRLRAAARRYVNYVSNTHRVYCDETR